MILFLAGSTFLVLSQTLLSDLALPLLVAGFLVAAAFVVLLFRHARVRSSEAWQAQLEHVSNQAGFRLCRAWDELDELDVAPAIDHPFADDLDVFGHASLLALLGSVGTRPGMQALRAWLMGPAPPSEIRARQEAVAELTPMLDFRDSLTARGRLLGSVTVEELESLLAWAEEPVWMRDKKVIRALAWVLPLLTGSSVALHVLGIVGYLWIAPIAVTLVVMRHTSGRILGDFARLSSGDSGLRRYAELVEEVAAQDFESPHLRGLRDGLTEGHEPAPGALRRLFRWIELSDLRLSDLHVPMNLLTLWDLHVYAALDRWRGRCGLDLRRWLDGLGKTDALSAVAGLAHAHPGWAFPRVEETAEPVVAAKGLGHPLLPTARCVTNDVTVGPQDTFLLVTGSNMSGKSTLLRAIGLNTVLAGAGAPACATSLEMPPVELRTSMRIRDSIEAGISYFMAELKRLKEVVDAARADSLTGGRHLLYLLDEILLGTNTAERQIAARRVIRHLLDSGAIGAVTTHDLTLADAEDLKARANPVFFTEAIGEASDDTVLRFDYQLRPGVANSTNALKLMRLIGLDGNGTRPGGGTQATD
ncbi:MAG: MutS family DNA mismatch repair protein [Gemmatimonadota bacterium]|nr:MAG: MutS family DNA mismatch repair protein [Gemmatimonadota bacterium]